MKATEQYFPTVLFINLHKVILSFETVDEILNCDHSNKKVGSSTLQFCNILQLNEISKYFFSFDPGYYS